MDRAFFEQLLYEEETSTLDVKKQQYRFVKATDDEKSELLKDILGFANAWRRSEAYILIGVEEVRGGRNNVVGIALADHLDDHSLQQFVNNLTNRPVRFHYEAFGFEGKQVGVIRIEQQPRPIYLKRHYGKLQTDKVYVRRGTSTDPSKPASPEEIALMGQTPGAQSAELVVEFADIERDKALGVRMAWDAEFVEIPPSDRIPDLQPPRATHPVLGIDLPALTIDPLNPLNREYFRELAEFEFVRRLFRPVRLVVRNVGQVSARNVRCELPIAANIGVVVMDSSDLPHAPKPRSSIADKLALKGSKPAFRTRPGDVTIDKNEERYRIGIECGDLQPGRRVWSDVFYVGKRESGELELAGHIYAENLPQPEEFTLAICATVSRTTMTVNELLNLPEPGA